MKLSQELQKKSHALVHALTEQSRYVSVLPNEILKKKPFLFDFTKNNLEITTLDVTDTKTFEEYVALTLKKANTSWGAGGYGEDRVVYQSPLFTRESEARSVHLAVDLWTEAGTPITAPLDGIVHSFQDNNHMLDYGPTIILQHKLNNITFHTLYGHLSRTSLAALKNGKRITAGEQIATIGKNDENGHWPPHLHFQIIFDMLGKKGDFPGVARPSEQEYYLTLCPDPNLILRIPSLKN